jgi:hypothetical protein
LISTIGRVAGAEQSQDGVLQGDCAGITAFILPRPRLSELRFRMPASRRRFSTSPMSPKLNQKRALFVLTNKVESDETT